AKTEVNQSPLFHFSIRDHMKFIRLFLIWRDIMKLTRIVLILTVLTFVYSAIVLAMMIPWVIITAVVILLLANAKKGYLALTPHGTARWARHDDLAGMLNAKTGLILGRLSPVFPSIPK